VRAGSFRLGIFTDEIATLADWREPTPLPHAPPAVRGVVSIQGRMLTVLDPEILFGATSEFSPAQIIALRGDEQLALAIEGTEGVVDVDQADIKPAEEMSSSTFLGVVNMGEQFVSVLDVKQLFHVAFQGRERRRRRF
jgi:purine-binding chemotaxis protein CheW